jgi:predicted alpha/beta superfamily hydrolase
MSRIIIAALFFLFGLNQVKSQNLEQIVIGTKRILHSNILNEEREYWINLPESYNNSEESYKKYPVLIVLDGNTHFKSITGMVSHMSGNGKIPEMIIVAVQNVDRRRDFTPDKIITVRENNSGGGKKFLSFLEDELIPELDRKYRTEPYRILYGHSLGGLLATHAYMKEKTLFNSFISVDPSLGTWDAKTMDEKLDSVTVNSFKRFIYFATANWGKRNIRNRDRHLRLYEALNSKCEGELNAKLEYFENENHGSVPPIAFYNGISTIFKDYDISFRDVDTKAQLIEHFQSISRRLSWNFRPPERLVNRIGYRMLRSRNENNKSKALEFFILNTQNFPNSSNAFDSLSEAYEVSGNKKKAIESYKKALELNTKSE